MRVNVYECLDRLYIVTEMTKTAKSEDMRNAAIKEAMRLRRELRQMGYIFPKESEPPVPNSIHPDDPNQLPF
jgi:hypothetical protein